ncbi:putative aldo-keto reductase 1 [Vitis vinifera]|uniref:Putative aldo-keto reductase 1 n=1 Tax=Vitis vinifera TaxID=29760 RepID=A0A438DRB9_VITVI|nr:putative aldo-keto reductase 1 [Vitis vinifera]
MAELQMVGVSKLGFGCRGLSGGYNNPVPGDVAIAIIKHAFSKGITFFDTADAYGAQANEVLIGKTHLVKEEGVIVSGCVIMVMSVRLGIKLEKSETVLMGRWRMWKD